MTTRIARLFAVLLLSQFLVACQSDAPIYDVRSQPIARADGNPLTTDEVQRAIIAAGTARGWIITPSGPDSLEASITVRKHSAECHIDYSNTSFSIQYVDSTSLDYGTTRSGQRVIHKNYNRWVNNLRNDVVLSLSALKD